MFLDIAVHKDGSYSILDMDEYETALRLEVLSKERIRKSKESLAFILDELDRGRFPRARIDNIAKHYLSHPVEC